MRSSLDGFKSTGEIYFCSFSTLKGVGLMLWNHGGAFNAIGERFIASGDLVDDFNSRGSYLSDFHSTEGCS